MASIATVPGAGTPEWGAGRWRDLFEIRDWKIERCFIYLDPDYAGGDTARYPSLLRNQQLISSRGHRVSPMRG